MKAAIGLEPRVRASMLDVARRAIGERLGDANAADRDELEFVEHASGIRGLYAFHVGGKPDEPLWVASWSTSRSIATFRAPALAIAQRGSPEILTEISARFDAMCEESATVHALFRPPGSARITCLDGPFYLMEWDHSTTIALAFFDKDGHVNNLALGHGFGAAERRRTAQPVVVEALPLSPPFDVIWGGSGLAFNKHADDRSERYAVDLEPTNANGEAVVRAPAAGDVVVAHDGEDDNPPFQSAAAASSARGNHVVIANGDVHIVLCHLRKGTVRVRKGDIVEPSDVIGIVGNSGNSSIPHLHVHVQEIAPPHHARPLLFRFAGRPRELRRGASISSAETR